MKGRWSVPLLVAVACFGPAIVATVLYYGPWGRAWLPALPGSRELLAVPVAVPEGWLTGPDDAYRWSLIYARMSPCAQQCAEPIARLRQVQLALGRDQNKVRRAFWYVAAAPALDDPELLARRLDDDAGRSLASALGAQRMADGRIFLADPVGRLILSYPADIEQKELLRDLKRLLAATGTGG